MSRILILGGLGMLGHELAYGLREQHQVTVTIRQRADDIPVAYPRVEVIGNTDLRQLEQVHSLITNRHWDVVVNAAGVIKHRLTRDNVSEAIAINALLPRELAQTCAQAGIRMIHFSTDCVFSGEKTSPRGPNGYRVGDVPDSRDLYGLSKLLGEPDQPGCLCIRTSLIGRELCGHHGLVDWYLGQPCQQVHGFTRALFNGLTTPVAARLVDFLIREQANLEGLWHVGSDPISKFALLSLIRARFASCADIVPVDEPFCDRRLDSTRFRSFTGWHAPAWDEMIDELAETGRR